MKTEDVKIKVAFHTITCVAFLLQKYPCHDCPLILNELFVLRSFPFLSLVGYVGFLGGASCFWGAGHHVVRGGDERPHDTSHSTISYWPGIKGANTE